MRDLDLHEKDLEILKSRTEWLNEAHTNAASKILSKQFPGINGFHNVTSIPFNKNGKWTFDKKLPLTKYPAVQIHYNGHNHWVTSVSLSENVYFLDSIYFKLKSFSINKSLQIQLAAMYGLSDSILEVTIPRIQQQHDYSQCGVFAIANAVEYCFSGKFWEEKHLNNYVISKMRNHLIICFENGKFTQFPSQPTIRKGGTSLYEIPISCPCRLPDSIDRLVNCNTCDFKQHISCIGSKNNKVDYICTNCQVKIK